MVLKHIAMKVSESRAHRILDNIRIGWANYNFIFYIGSVAAILGNVFGLAGWGAVLLTLALFYYAGVMHSHIEETKKRKNKELHPEGRGFSGAL